VSKLISVEKGNIALSPILAMKPPQLYRSPTKNIKVTPRLPLRPLPESLGPSLPNPAMAAVPEPAIL